MGKAGKSKHGIDLIKTFRNLDTLSIARSKFCIETRASAVFETLFIDECYSEDEHTELVNMNKSHYMELASGRNSMAAHGLKE